MIRATQYLPNILKLQQYLLSFHHHHSTHVQLKDKKIVHVIREAENGIVLLLPVVSCSYIPVVPCSYIPVVEIQCCFLQIAVYRCKRWLKVLEKHGIW